MKIPFYVTDTAGKEVAGLRNPGVGKAILLTESQAEQPLRMRHITRKKPAAPAEKDAAPSKSEQAKK